MSAFFELFLSDGTLHRKVKFALVCEECNHLGNVLLLLKTDRALRPGLLELPNHWRFDHGRVVPLVLPFGGISQGLY